MKKNSVTLISDLQGVRKFHPSSNTVNSIDWCSNDLKKLSDVVHSINKRPSEFKKYPLNSSMPNKFPKTTQFSALNREIVSWITRKIVGCDVERRSKTYTKFINFRAVLNILIFVINSYKNCIIYKHYEKSTNSFDCLYFSIPIWRQNIGKY